MTAIQHISEYLGHTVGTILGTGEKLQGASILSGFVSPVSPRVHIMGAFNKLFAGSSQPITVLKVEELTYGAGSSDPKVGCVHCLIRCVEDVL